MEILKGRTAFEDGKFFYLQADFTVSLDTEVISSSQTLADSVASRIHGLTIYIRNKWSYTTKKHKPHRVK